MRLKPKTTRCSYCYHGRARIVYVERDPFGEEHVKPYFALCDYCGTGVSGSTEEEAVEKWNNLEGIPKY